MTSSPITTHPPSPHNSDDFMENTTRPLTREQIIHKTRSWRARCKRSDVKYDYLLEQVGALRDHVTRLSTSIDILKYSELDGRSKLSELARRVDQLTGERTSSSSYVPACTICLKNPCSYVANPCGHVLYCDSCYGAASVVSSCPICRVRTDGFLRILF